MACIAVTVSLSLSEEGYAGDISETYERCKGEWLTVSSYSGDGASTILGVIRVSTVVEFKKNITNLL